MKKVENRIVIMALGIMVAVAIVFSQLFYFQETTAQKEENKTEQHQEEKSEGQIFISVPSTNLPSSLHVELNPNVFFMFEILLEKITSKTPEFKFTIPAGQFFRTLFGVTISPNAP